MTYVLLFYEFLKIGLFAVGGGYATIPFLFHLTEIYNWFTPVELTDMIAISNLTPGPVGINMATYTGFTTANVLGACVSTFAIVLSPFIITLLTIYFINKFRETSAIKTVFEALRPASCALLTFVAVQLILQNIFNMTAGVHDFNSMDMTTDGTLDFAFTPLEDGVNNVSSAINSQMSDLFVSKLSFNLKAFWLTLTLFVMYGFTKSRPGMIIIIGALLGIIFG